MTWALLDQVMPRALKGEPAGAGRGGRWGPLKQAALWRAEALGEGLQEVGRVPAGAGRGSPAPGAASAKALGWGWAL